MFCYAKITFYMESCKLYGDIILCFLSLFFTATVLHRSFTLLGLPYLHTVYDVLPQYVAARTYRG